MKSKKIKTKWSTLKVGDLVYGAPTITMAEEFLLIVEKNDSYHFLVCLNIGWLGHRGVIKTRTMNYQHGPDNVEDCGWATVWRK
jgi:hypothetical protein